MKHLKRFNESLNKEIKCKWCDKKFKPLIKDNSAALQNTIVSIIII
jgi:hypothetical protein